MPELTSMACAWLAQRRRSALLKMAWSSAQAVTALPSLAQTRWALVARQPLGLHAVCRQRCVLLYLCILAAAAAVLLLCLLHAGSRCECASCTLVAAGPLQPSFRRLL